MSDYSKWKVTELKAELKNRGVPQTGLRLKQDFIDKLTELDTESGEHNAAQNASTGPSAENDEQNKEAAQEIDEFAPTPQQSSSESLPAKVATSLDSLGAQLHEPPGATEATPIGPKGTTELKDAGLEVTQTTHATKQTSTDHQAKQSDEADSDAAADSQKVESTDRTAQAQRDESSPEVSMPAKPYTPAEQPTKNQGIESEPPTDGGEDLRKRKRRSQSPPPTIETVKKSKIENGNPRVILKEDAHPRESTSDEMELENKTEASTTTRQDPRLRDLLPSTSPPKSVQTLQETPQEVDREVEPALHPATSSIYIRDLMRPLQPASLKAHLTELAKPAGHASGGEPLVDFFLDSVKTHCFARFDSVPTASRVRSKLHRTVWPDERGRKPLLVDFIPDEKFGEWVRTEQESAAGRGTQRWEIFYEHTDNGVEAILQDARNGTRAGRQPTAPTWRHSTDAESRRDMQPAKAAPQQQQKGRAKNFKALDERFRSTKAKPKLYYLPVSRDIVEKRLAQFDTLVRNDSRSDGKGDEDMRRITFEDTDIFVDGGPEFPGPPRNGGRRGDRGPWRGRRR